MRGGIALFAVLALAVISAWLLRVPPVPPEDAAAPIKFLPVAFLDLPGWARGRQSEAVPALNRSCARLLKRNDDQPVGPEGLAGSVKDWRGICESATDLNDSSDQAVQTFLETHFQAYAVHATSGPKGLFTGYYEPHLNGARSQSDDYFVPLYGMPPDLVMVDLGQFRDDLKGRRIAGTVNGHRLRPFPDRREIESGALSNQGLELVWVDDPVAAFFLHIQGSGRVTLDDGTAIRVGYAGQNGHPYTAIGRVLLDMGALQKGAVSLQSIREWLNTHSEQAHSVMNQNRSFVFFTELTDDGPIGAQGVVLTAERSLAIDRTQLPLGAPIWLDTRLPDAAGGAPFQRLMVAQDTGGAIRGAIRGDVFWGYGDRAELIAGHMQSEGRYYLLLPKSVAMPAAGHERG